METVILDGRALRRRVLVSVLVAAGAYTALALKDFSLLELEQLLERWRANGRPRVPQTLRLPH